MVKRLALAVAVAALSGCHLTGLRLPPGRPVREAHAGGHDLRVLDTASPLRAHEQLPVLSTPEVFAAYVPSHAERDMLVGEHWIFFKLRDAEWFVEKLHEPEPPTEGNAPSEHLRPLDELEWKNIVIPYTPTSP